MSTSMNRRRMAVAAIAVLAASGMAACSDTGPIAPTGQAPAPPTAPETDPAPEPETDSQPAPEPETDSQPAPEPETDTETSPAPDPNPPSGDGAVTVTGDLTGTVPADGAATITLEVTERAAVAVGATSEDGGDLELYITGGGIDEGIDDSHGYADVFSFDQSGLDPALTHVLEPGSYQIDITEYGGDENAYTLEVLSGTQVVNPGDSVDVSVPADGAAQLFISELSSGSETFQTSGSTDTKLWVFTPSDHTSFEDDDSGDSLNAAIGLPGVTPEAVVVAVGTWQNRGGDTTLSVQ